MPLTGHFSTTINNPLFLCENWLESQDGEYRGTRGSVSLEEYKKCISKWTSESFRIYNDIRISPANVSNFDDTRSLTIIRGNGLKTLPESVGTSGVSEELVSNLSFRETVSWQFVKESAWVDCQNRLVHVVDRSPFNESTLPDVFKPSPDYRKKNIIQTINSGLGDEIGADHIISKVCGNQSIPMHKEQEDRERLILSYNFGPKIFSGMNGELFEVDQHTLIKKGPIRNFWIKRTDNASRWNLLYREMSSGIMYSRISINCDTGEFRYLVNNFDGNRTVDPDQKWIKAKPKTPEFNYIFGDPRVDEYTPLETVDEVKPWRRTITYPAKARTACFL